MPTEYYVKKTELNERGLRWCLDNGYAVLRNQEENQDGKEEGAIATALSNNNDSDLGQIIDDAEESKLSLGETTTTNDDNSNPNLNNAATQSKEKEKGAKLTSASSSNETSDRDDRQKRDDDNSTTKQHRKAIAAAASVKNLKRKNHNTIWVRIGKTDHQAYELYNPNNVISSKNNNNDNNEEEEEGSTMIWVEWLTTGKKECVPENQINRNGLEGRKRSRPSCFSP
jgi:hypothetical protein